MEKNTCKFRFVGLKLLEEPLIPRDDPESYGDYSPMIFNNNYTIQRDTRYEPSIISESLNTEHYM